MSTNKKENLTICDNEFSLILKPSKEDALDLFNKVKEILRKQEFITLDDESEDEVIAGITIYDFDIELCYKDKDKDKDEGVDDYGTIESNTGGDPSPAFKETTELVIEYLNKQNPGIIINTKDICGVGLNGEILGLNLENLLDSSLLD